MRTCDVLIIGAGAIGSSIAYHLALKGIKKIIVIEKSALPGEGSTGKATGGYRAQFGSEINIRLSLLARNKLLTFEDEHGIDPCYEQNGYLFIAQNEDELARLKAALILQNNCGLSDAREVSVDDITKLNPFIDHRNITGGSFCASDGFIAPLNILKGYTESAKDLGAEFIYECELTGFRKSPDSRIISASTSQGEISAGIVINAAGAWAGVAAEKAGVNIPVVPLKRQAAVLKEENILPSKLPMTIFVDNSFHFRMRNGKVILLLPTENEIKEPFDMSVEDSWLEKISAIAKKRVPLFKDCIIDKPSSIAGLYEMSPDEHVLLGLAPAMSNFFLANGSSGHGVMHSPALGQLMAELIADEKTSINIDQLRPSRFIENKPIQSIQFF